MLTDGRFWVGIVVGAAGYHLWRMRQAKTARAGS